MPSAMRLVPIRLLTLGLTGLALTGCAATPSIVATPSACAGLLPPEWSSPIEGAPLPPIDNAAVGDWLIFADAQTARLGMANDRLIAAIGIVTRCEARDRAVIERARRPWWRRW